MATKKTTKAAATAPAKETKYTKVALVGSKKFEGRRDLLNALLDNGKMYTIAEVETAINNYLNKEV